MSDIAVELMPLDTLHRIMSVNINASKTLETNTIAGLKFTDIEKNDANQKNHYTLNVRKGILEIDPPNNKEKFRIETDILTWKQLVLGKITPKDAVKKEVVVISNGSVKDFYTFMGLFE